MAYNEFAYFYDELNGEADYDAVYSYIKAALDAHGMKQGIVVDLGCGTGDLTLMLTQAGFDMIGVDSSDDMLAVLREKADELQLSDKLLLLNQDILSLDLYGTVNAVISTFDTFNHIGPKENFEKAIEKAAFFMEKGGVFIFDLNTPYKHKNILADNTFTLEGPDAICNWHNHYDEKDQSVAIDIHIEYLDTGELFHESFKEYTYELDYVKSVLKRYGFELEALHDGEMFTELQDNSQRYIFTAVKQYTQTEN